MAESQWKDDKTRAWLRRFNRSQLPFVATVMLNDLAFKAREAVQIHLGKELTLRNQWVKRGVVVVKATKRTLLAEVKHRDSFMYKQEHGDTVRAEKGKIAIPRSIRKDQTKRITKAKRPRRLLAKSDKYYVGQHGILKRTKRKGPNSVMYLLAKQVRYRPSISMTRTVNATVAAHQGQSWRKAFNRFVIDGS